MKKRDIIIIASLLAAALAGFVLVNVFGSQRGDTGYVYIKVKDQLYESAPLNEDRVITIDQGSGTVNHVEIKDGAVRMLDSTCADKQCVHQGDMTAENINERALRNYIICLPNKVTVELRLQDGET